MHNQLQLREIFHIEFLRRLAGDLPPRLWELKGGVNLRLFFKSIRYSEDMDLDVKTLPVDSLKKRVMRLLGSPSFIANLKTYGIREIKPPDMAKAKQTSTTQRFKIHLITSSGEDYFTKIEFSRRGFSGEPVAESVPANILRPYGMTPFIVSHYPARDAAVQKVAAILSRSSLQPRDIFDLYFLSSQADVKTFRKPIFEKDGFLKASEYVKAAEFRMFNDMVVAYMSVEDRRIYGSPESWKEIKLKTAAFMEELERLNA